MEQNPVLAFAPESITEADLGAKRDEYVTFDMPQYWRFDQTVERHHARLAGDRLADGACQPILIEHLDDGGQQGYSPVSDLWYSGKEAYPFQDWSRPL